MKYFLNVIYFIFLCAIVTSLVQYTLYSQTKTESWFKVKQIADKVWRIDDHGSDNIYLVEGRDEALLIDAGTGVADLSGYIKSITALPVIVVNTHGHLDHCGSDYQFKEVYAHPLEFEMIKFYCNEDYHRGAVEKVENDSPQLAPLLVRDFENVGMPDLLPVKEGFIFDLGKRKLEVIEVPAHTKGSICLLDAEDKLLFTGDNNNNVVWLFMDGCLPVESYLMILQKLQRRSGEFNTVLSGHGEPIDKEFIDEQVVCAQNILSGDCKGEPYKTFVDYAKVCYYKRAGIVFNPDNLRVK